jgi:hypothetical protein
MSAPSAEHASTVALVSSVSNTFVSFDFPSAREAKVNPRIVCDFELGKVHSPLILSVFSTISFKVDDPLDLIQQ